MKRAFHLFWFLALPVCSILHSDEPQSPAERIAQGQFEEQRYQKLRAALEDLQTAYAAQHDRMNKVTQDITDRLREQAENQKKWVARAEFDQLVETVKELDRKREADKKLILEEIRKIAASLKAVAEAPAPKSEPGPPAREYVGSYQHEVEAGQNLYTIIKAYNSEYGLDINVADVQAVNPGLNPDLIRPGMVLNIPQPKK